MQIWAHCRSPNTDPFLARGYSRPSTADTETLMLTSSYRNTFAVPDIPCELCLLLCPQTILLGLLFVDDAFAAPSLSLEMLFKLRIPLGKADYVL